MRRMYVSLFVGLLLIVGLVAGAAGRVGSIHQNESVLGQATPTSGTPGPTQPGILPPELQFLTSMTPEQRFDHMTGIQMRFVNPQGQEVVLNVTPGTITAVSATSVTLQPNGTSQTRTFTVTSDTFIRGTSHRGSLTVFAAGDKAMVFTIGTSSNATAIVEPGFMMGMAGHHGMGPGMMEGQPGRGPMPGATQPSGATPSPTTMPAPTGTPVPTATATS